MAERLFTAFLGIPVFLGALYLGGLWWASLILLLAILSSLEMGSLLRSSDALTPSRSLIAIGGVSFIFLAYQFNGESGLALPLLVFLLLIAFVRELFLSERRPAYGVGGTLLGIFYPGVLFSHLILLRQMPSGLALTLLIVLGTWASDSAAYFCGRSFGKRKLLPAVSPKKTLEGAFGGLLGGSIIGAVAAPYALIPVWVGAGCGFLVSVSGQLGDLAASALKREAGVKDTGALLPGHGGVLDRFDSLLFAGPVVYYTLLLLRGWPMG